MSTVAKARRAAIIQLHTIARPHFHYPPLSRFAWTLPTVIEWEPWEGEPANRYEDRLWGKLIVPSVVVFVVPNQPNIDTRRFRLDLQRLTHATWYLDEANLASLYLIGRYRKDGKHMTGRPDVPKEKEREVWTCGYCGQFFTDRRQFDNHRCGRND